MSATFWMTLDQLREWDKNPKRHPDANVNEIARSIKRFGFVAPVVVWESCGQIVAGHGRYRAAALILKRDPGALLALDAPGPGLIPVRLVEFASEHEAAAYALTDNRLTEVNPMDAGEVAAILKEIEAATGSVDVPGYSVEDVTELLAGAAPSTGQDEGAEDPPEVADSKLGEVYELGPHRLVCGDSRDATAWGKLLPGGERLQCVWTDPPYGVSMDEKNKHWQATGKASSIRSNANIQNDSLSPSELETFLRGALGATMSSCAPGSAWYVAAPAGPPHGVFSKVLSEFDLWRHTLVWVKHNFVLGRADYHYRHEPIFYGWVPGAPHYWCGSRKLDSVLEFDRPSASKEHPTMKPIELVEFCINNSSQPGWIVGEPFGGSGTTLIACAKTGRVARLIELDPRYCDVIRRRWTKYAISANIDPGSGRLD